MAILLNISFAGCFDKLIHAPTLRNAQHVVGALKGLGGVPDSALGK